MGKFRDLIGTISTFFQFGLAGNAVKNHADGLEVRLADDSASANMTVAAPQGANQNTHAAQYLDVKRRAILIEFSFDGATPPAAGVNTGNYGICHTTGGGYTQGQVVYDDGVSLTTLVIYKMQCIVTNSSSVSGGISLIANGVYQAESGTAPYSWTLKGDGSATSTGFTKSISVPIALAATTDSTTSIPTGAQIMQVHTNITTPYSGGATIAVSVNGATPLTIQATSKNNPQSANNYTTEDWYDVAAANAGVVRVTIGGAPAAGAGEVVVEYVETFLP